MDMVGRVERAILAADDGVFIPDFIDEFGKAHFRRIARAAIEAMREPTDEMLRAASPNASHQLVARALWQAMIGSILKSTRE